MKDAPNRRFVGFEIPDQNWFRMPNSWTDITRSITSLAELKVVEYVLRHTWGYQEFGIAKRISINEFMNGRRRADGSRMDHGTGLSNRSVIDGLRNAVKHGYLQEDVDASDRGRVKKYYLLRMRSDTLPAASTEPGNLPEVPSGGSKNDSWKHLQPAVKNLHREVNKVHRGSEESSRRSEKDTQERSLTVTMAGNGGDHDSPIRQLPDRTLEPEQVDLLARDILEQFGDESSLPFYALVARRVPESIVREVISSIRQDESIRYPARVFVYRINAWARDWLNKEKKAEIDRRKQSVGSERPRPIRD